MCCLFLRALVLGQLLQRHMSRGLVVIWYCVLYCGSIFVVFSVVVVVVDVFASVVVVVVVVVVVSGVVVVVVEDEDLG